MKNLWKEHSSVLVDAYLRSAGPVQFELVSRALSLHMPARPQRVVDVGGGFGRQAIILARAGHIVTLIDFDEKMLEIARSELLKEKKAVSSLVELVHGDGANAISLAGTDFDLACCHSVLMYEADPVPILNNLVGMVKAGGLISILSLNTEAIAMRMGLQGRWKESRDTLESGALMDNQSLPIRLHSLHEIIATLEKAGAQALIWYGVGIFTDHRTETITVDNPDDVFEAEWLAGSKDPYRQVARCFHLIAQRK